MIQAPQAQYIQSQVPVQTYVPQQGANTVANTYQVPNPIYNYPVASCYSQPAAKSQFNGVNIEIINPQGQSVPQGALTMPANFVPMNNVPVMPPVLTEVPVAQPVAQPVVQPMMQPVEQPVTQPVVQPIAQPVAQSVVQPMAQPEVQPVAQQVAQPVVPEPVITPTVEAAAQVNTTQTPEAFAGKLATTDVNAQKAAIEELADLVKNNDQVAPILLDTQVFEALNNIINKDTSALEGPTPEVLELRAKPQDQLTAEEQTKASTLSPLEEAEFNKQYALYTIAYMQDRLNNELVNRGQAVVELKDLPSIENVINALKSNPNPGVRVSALASLAHIAKPEYKQDLTTIFELAKADEDPTVQQEATTALDNLNKLPDAAAPVAQ